MGKLVIGASESDLSNGHLVFARVGVEFWAILTFTAASKTGIHGYLGSKKLHTPTHFFLVKICTEDWCFRRWDFLKNRDILGFLLF